MYLFVYIHVKYILLLFKRQKKGIRVFDFLDYGQLKLDDCKFVHFFLSGELGKRKKINGNG